MQNNKKAGRPIIGEPKDNRVNLRVRNKEKQMIRKGAKERNQTISDYLVSLVKKDVLKPT
mgnify:CR=1 FL=1